jgi:hypothetical protein
VDKGVERTCLEVEGRGHGEPTITESD